MFRLKTKTGRGILTSAQIKDYRREAVVDSNRPTAEMAKALKMPPNVLEELQGLWEARKSFQIPLEIEGQTREGSVGLVLPLLLYDGEIRLGVKLFKDEDDWEYDRPYLRLFHDEVKEEHAETLEKAWEVVEPVMAMVADASPRPNDRCLCGSGRKFKKCCGR